MPKSSVWHLEAPRFCNLIFFWRQTIFKYGSAAWWRFWVFTRSPVVGFWWNLEEIRSETFPDLQKTVKIHQKTKNNLEKYRKTIGNLTNISREICFICDIFYFPWPSMNSYIICPPQGSWLFKCFCRNSAPRSPVGHYQVKLKTLWGQTLWGQSSEAINSDFGLWCSLLGFEVGGRRTNKTRSPLRGSTVLLPPLVLSTLHPLAFFWW